MTLKTDLTLQQRENETLRAELSEVRRRLEEVEQLLQGMPSRRNCMYIYNSIISVWLFFC